MQPDRIVLGVLLIIAFCAVAPLADSVAKLIGDRLPLATLVLIRFAMQAALLLPLALIARQPLWWDARINRLVWIRTALHIAGIGLMFLSLRLLPLADAIAIAFVMPFILLLLGNFFLGEEVGWRRLGACIVGFAGTLCVIQPSFAEVGLWALMPLGVAVNFALFMLVTRQIAPRTDPVAMQTTSGAMAIAILVPLMLLGGAFDMREAAFTMPEGEVLWLCIALGVLGTGAHLLMTWSLRFAPASTLAPLQYLEIPVATAFGLLIFGDFPDGLALFGIALTIAAGLYILERERRISRSARVSPPPAPPAA